jgi:RNA-directed DNA polymerase
MNQFLKYSRQTGRGEAWQAHVVNYADNFVILSRSHHAAEALAWTDRTMTRLGLAETTPKGGFAPCQPEGAPVRTQVRV